MLSVNSIEHFPDSDEWAAIRSRNEDIFEELEMSFEGARDMIRSVKESLSMTKYLQITHRAEITKVENDFDYFLNIF